MSKKTFKLQTNKMLIAALFTLLAVGLYAHVDSFVTKSEISQNVLGETSSPARNVWEVMLCRLKYGSKCTLSNGVVQPKVDDSTMSTDALIQRELKNIENEVKTDQGASQNSSYWSM